MIDHFARRIPRRQPKQAAWLLIFIEPTTRMVVGAGIYSEPSPTMTLARSSALLRKIEDIDYHTAHQRMVKLLVEDATLAWVVDLLAPAHDREAVREAKALLGGRHG